MARLIIFGATEKKYKSKERNTSDSSHYSFNNCRKVSSSSIIEKYIRQGKLKTSSFES
jgi:hypothetical protein